MILIRTPKLCGVCLSPAVLSLSASGAKSPKWVTIEDRTRYSCARVNRNRCHKLIFAKLVFVLAHRLWLT